MVAAFGFNASILLAFVLIPLICPPMLPRLFNSFLMEAFVPPKPQQPQPTVQTARSATEMQNGVIFAPSTIPAHPYVPSGPEPPIDVSISGPNFDNSTGFGQPYSGHAAYPVVRPVVNTRLRISTSVEEGLLIDKRMPVYPVIAKAAGISGTVTLAAIISKTGTIENLRVTGGPVMLQQAALDAVSTWRYRPYLLDGQPVEVETTVSVIFTLQR